MKEAERQRKWSDGTVGNDSNAKAARKNRDKGGQFVTIDGGVKIW